MTPGNGVTLQYRSSDGGACNNSTTSASAPYWVKLVMSSGTNFTGYCSPNGTTWTLVGSTSLLASITTAYVGLAVCSHNASDLCTATFDNVSAPGWPLTPLAAIATAVCANQVNLTWNAVANATSYSVKRSTTSGGPYTTIAIGVTNTSYTDIGVPVSAGCYYVISAMVGGSQTANGPQAALTFLPLPEPASAIIGTPGSWSNDGNTITNVFDNNLTTFFDGPDANGDWVGLDYGAGVSNVIKLINYCPRAGFEPRMERGIFEGANQTSFSDEVTLYTVTAQPATGVFTSVSLTDTAAFRFVRYLSPPGTTAFATSPSCSFVAIRGPSRPARCWRHRRPPVWPPPRFQAARSTSPGMRSAAWPTTMSNARRPTAALTPSSPTASPRRATTTAAWLAAPPTITWSARSTPGAPAATAPRPARRRRPARLRGCRPRRFPPARSTSLGMRSPARPATMSNAR